MQPTIIHAIKSSSHKWLYIIISFEFEFYIHQFTLFRLICDCYFFYHFKSSGTSYLYTNGYFGLGTGAIMLSGLGCTSSEASVISCPHTSSVLGTTGCNHSADAGVSCTSGWIEFNR